MAYPEVQTLLEGITVGGRKLSDERQILNLSESANELIRLVRSGQFRLDKHTSDLLNGLIATGEALEAGHFRGEGSVITQVNVNWGRTARTVRRGRSPGERTCAASSSAVPR